MSQSKLSPLDFAMCSEDSFVNINSHLCNLSRQQNELLQDILGEELLPGQRVLYRITLFGPDPDKTSPEHHRWDIWLPFRYVPSGAFYAQQNQCYPLVLEDDLLVSELPLPYSLVPFITGDFSTGHSKFLMPIEEYKTLDDVIDVLTTDRLRVFAKKNMTFASFRGKLHPKDWLRRIIVMSGQTTQDPLRAPYLFKQSGVEPISKIEFLKALSSVDLLRFRKSKQENSPLDYYGYSLGRTLLFPSVGQSVLFPQLPESSDGSSSYNIRIGPFDLYNGLGTRNMEMPIYVRNCSVYEVFAYMTRLSRNQVFLTNEYDPACYADCKTLGSPWEAMKYRFPVYFPTYGVVHINKLGREFISERIRLPEQQEKRFTLRRFFFAYNSLDRFRRGSNSKYRIVYSPRGAYYRGLSQPMPFIRSMNNGYMDKSFPRAMSLLPIAITVDGVPAENYLG